jgi:hypothetical protein
VGLLPSSRRLSKTTTADVTNGKEKRNNDLDRDDNCEHENDWFYCWKKFKHHVFILVLSIMHAYLVVPHQRRLLIVCLGVHMFRSPIHDENESSRNTIGRRGNASAFSLEKSVTLEQGVSAPAMTPVSLVDIDSI